MPYAVISRPEPERASSAHKRRPFAAIVCCKASASDRAEKFSYQPGRAVLPIRLLTMTLCLAFVSPPVFAYIDPNAGGFLFQLLAPLIAIAMSIWMFFAQQMKSAWRSLLSIFGCKIDHKRSDQEKFDQEK